VTSVFAVERGNANNVIQASQFVVLNNNLIDALFNFGSANAGKTFLIFVTGPGGTSRNLTALPAGSPAGCPLGNEQGVQVTFTCSSSTTPNPGPGADVAVLASCKVNRSSSGTFTLGVEGTNFKEGISFTVGGQVPRKVKLKSLQTGSNTFNKATLKGRFCNGLPGAIVATNPGARASNPLQCSASCN
jgi:hypothetical protein